jgi:hypothetical protein
MIYIRHEIDGFGIRVLRVQDPDVPEMRLRVSRIQQHGGEWLHSRIITEDEAQALIDAGAALVDWKELPPLNVIEKWLLKMLVLYPGSRFALAPLSRVLKFLRLIN